MFELAYKRYRRPFQRPICTAGHTWRVREGLIVRLTNERGLVGFGEIAPAIRTGTETVDSAERALDEMNGEISGTDISMISSSQPSLRFGLESAALMVAAAGDGPNELVECAGLVPLDKEAARRTEAMLDRGFSILKTKIGVHETSSELHWLGEMDAALRGRGKIRLDANGSLTEAQTQRYGEELAEAAVEFLEQPLPVGAEIETNRLAKELPFALALDESVREQGELYELAFRFPRLVFVVKPALAGSPGALRAWRTENRHVDLIYSTAFETAVGQEMLLRLAAADEDRRHAVGFGAGGWFADGLGQADERPLRRCGEWNAAAFGDLWKRL